MLDLPLAQPAATPRIAVAFVTDEVIWARPRSPPPGGARNTDAVQDGLELRAVVALSRRDDNGERPPAPVTGEMELGRQPATTASESLVGGVGDPFFSSARLRRRRAPLAC
jgi:hypothetical protein